MTKDERFALMLSERLKELRANRGWSQWDVCKRCGVNPQLYRRYEAAEVVPMADKIPKLCKVFGVSADYLVGMDELY